MHDAQTIGFYDGEARKYAARYGYSNSPNLNRFLEILQPAAHILELGCGSGRDAAAMLARGFQVDPTDGSPEMAAEASRRLDRPVRALLFDELDSVDRYDGVWANACLLHEPVANLPDVLARIHRALRAGGWFYASYKAGQGEGRDRFGRYYNYPTQEELSAAYRSAADWHRVEITQKSGSGYDDQPTDWLIVFAQA